MDGVLKRKYMATNLFGPSPLELQQAQQAGLRTQASQYAQLSPLERASQGLYQAGSNIGGGIAGLMGIKDPAMERQSALTAITSKYDINSPDSLLKAVPELIAAGFQQEAVAASTRAQEISKAQSDLAASKTKTALEATQVAAAPGARARTEAETRKIESEIISKAAEQQAKLDRVTALVGMGLSEEQAKGIASNDTAFSSYLQSKKVATPPDYAVQAQLEGFSAKPFLSDYTPQEMLKMEKGVFAHKAGVAGAGRTTVINQQEGALAKGMGEDQAKALADARMSASGAGPAIDRLNTLEKLNKEGKLFEGPQANSTLTAANFLNSVGLLSKENVGALASSEVYNKTAKDLVLQDLNNKLGAGISSTDRDYIEARIPQLTTSPKARTEIISKLKEIQYGKVGYYKDMIGHVQKNKNLNDFDFSKNMPISSTPVASTGNALVDKYLNMPK